MMTWHRRCGLPCDTHVLVHHSRRRAAWLEQCLASLENEPTNILLVHDDGDNVGAARAAAHAQGNAPFLSFVDDDDWVMPGAFAACLAALHADPALVGAYTDFADVDCESGAVLNAYTKRPWTARSQLLRPFEVLHVHVYRRAPAMKYLAEMARWKTLEESLLMGLLVQDGDWRKLDLDGYRKRLHNRGAGSRVTPALLRDLTRRLAPILLAHGKPPAPAPGVRSRVRAWANTPTGCRGCDGVRRVVGKVAGSAGVK